ncbi:MAG: hypothetical protein ACYS9X_06050 [Planctomycetota bacterium]|jgi:hypothetical protein
MSEAVKAKTIISLDGGKVRVSGDVTLDDLRGSLPERELLVEPLSASQPLAEFLSEGGVGFGSLMNGTFAGQILQVKSTYPGSDPAAESEIRFAYGHGTMPLYNVGYPLQRIMEGPRPDFLKNRFGPPEEMVLPTRERAGVAVEHSASDGFTLPDAGGADEVMFVNAAAATVMGLPGAGVVKVRRGAQSSGADVWPKRFFLSRVPHGQGKLVVLTQPSGAKVLHEAHRASSGEGIFMALSVHLGVLVAATAPASAVYGLAGKAKDTPLTWRLGA